MATEHPNIPIHVSGDLRLVRLEDIPEPLRGAFQSWLVGQTVPILPGYGDVAYLWDWTRWLELGMPGSDGKRI